MSQYSEEVIAEYEGNITKIVEQLESCNYECEGSVLVNNVAFIALKRMMGQENKHKKLLEEIVERDRYCTGCDGHIKCTSGCSLNQRDLMREASWLLDKDS